MTSNDLPNRFDEAKIQELLLTDTLSTQSDSACVLDADVFIAGTGPVGAAYARIILDAKPDAKVIMADIGSQENSVVGAHFKNSVKYQKDIDLFVNVIKGALQAISIPPEDTFISNLGGQGWKPSIGGDKTLIFQGNNPQQKRELNLKASAVTRTVGGMATHWTCACPIPHEDERKQNPIEWNQLRGLLYTARKKLLKVDSHQFDNSVRHTVVKKALIAHIDSARVKNLPLAVKRRKDNPHFVTWSATDTVFGNTVNKLQLLAEHRVTKVVGVKTAPGDVKGVLLRDLKEDKDRVVRAKAIILCCGAVPTPQILFNSGITDQTLPALGHYLCEQSLTFCQIALKHEYIDAIPTKDPFHDFKHSKEAILKHLAKYKSDPLPIPFSDPEPQVTLPYSRKYPWHVQIHRDAFNYGEVGPRADSRVVVDLRWFGAQESKKDNYVTFGGTTDIYGMPQATFNVKRSEKDEENDQKMMGDMTQVANVLGSYIPGSYPQFMEPGLVLHITGTIRIGENDQTSVADPESRVHGFKNLWVGGNGCIPDATACNPTSTSVAIAIKGARAVLRQLWPDLKAKLQKDEEEERKAGMEDQD
ncbi:pyranose 2-oxidase [Boletus edulis BED1]|uniref:Pyranose 2-oxidase n=1 Tax=Boletus edulis BED1 TaxID=1328754 RepID=A0AAD4BE63_BOLED|nr:pyranose 2-oxidase [Boletus edulis BED1]